MRNVIFFCEGDNKKSLDWQIFDKLFDGVSLTSSTLGIKGMNSKRGRDRYTEGYSDAKKSNLSSTETPIIVFRDRDFDIEVPLNGSLFRAAGGKNVTGNRTTVENYLLKPEVFADYVATTMKGKKPISNETEAVVLFEKAAKKIKAHQAARHALGEILRIGYPGIPSNLTKNNKFLVEGQLPTDLTENGCLQNGKLILQNYSSKALHVNESLFETLFQKYLTQFNDDFFTNRDYLIWFNGKNIAAAINTECQHLDFKDYYKFALQKLDFSDSNTQQELPDLIELRNMIGNLLNA